MVSEAGQLYLGRTVETDEPLLYPAANLTTHGLIVGMTGSGKTGLGIGLIEEALLNRVPCLVLDPKGDMGNLLLNFPDLDAEDFEPWIDPAAATNDDTTVSDVAEATANRWREGLAGHGIDQQRMRDLKDRCELTIYTPGSAAGVGLNVLGSLNPPGLDWDTDAEVMRDEIQSIVSSLLVMGGIESDPIAGPEHILLATIVETFWKRGESLDLGALIGQIPNPPFRKMGVFDVDAFIPEKDRTTLALRLNGLLASPSFSSWLEGVPLDIGSLIGEADTPRAAIVYLAHLSDEERQFVVTLLLSKMVTWIRSQPGTSDLRTLIYMDEVFGFAPPTAAPPSKRPILTILKQARAHGVGMVLATQNPMDVDYKAMSNAGTWMVGRLQTENDKRRILEGLAAASGSVDTDALDTLISDLDERQFVLHSTKLSEPVLFGTRWAMSYLAGPLTRDQVSTLMAGRKPDAPTGLAAAAAESTPEKPDGDTVPVAPTVAEDVGVSYLDPATPWQTQLGADPTGAVWEPAGAATVQLLYDESRAEIQHRETFEAVVYPLDGIVDTDQVIVVDHDPRDFRSDPPSEKPFRLPDVRLDTKTFWKGLAGDLEDHLVAHRPITVFRAPELDLYSRVDETATDFKRRCADAAEEAADDEVAKLRDRYRTRIDRVKDEIATAEGQLDEAEQDVSASHQDELLAGAGDLLGALLGGRTRSNPLGRAASRRAETQKAQARARAQTQKLADRHRDLVELENELAEEVAEIVSRHTDMADQIEEVEIGLEKDDIRMAELKLVWIPVR